MASLFSSSPAAAGVARLAARLRAERHSLVRRWQRELSAPLPPPSPDADEALPGVIADIAERLIDDAFDDGSRGSEALRAAALLGDLRYTQKMSIGEVVDEWHRLEDVLQAFICDEAKLLPPELGEPAGVVASRLVQREMRAVHRRALESYAAGADATAEGLRMQLRRVGQLVIHEIRRPLSVLRVLARTLTVADGDVDAVRMVEILDRSVVRLADVTREIDQRSGVTHHDPK